eukprot:6550584-Pyramimonas_sp.AAC.1
MTNQGQQPSFYPMEGSYGPTKPHKGCWGYIRGGPFTIQLYQSYWPGPIAGSRCRAYLLSGCKDNRPCRLDQGRPYRLGLT